MKLSDTLLCIALVGCSTPADTERAWTILPSHSAGAVTRTSSERDLVAAYGQDAVQASRIELGEGETAPGTVLFGADSARRLEIIWKDTVARAQPARLAWQGSKSLWELPGGISLGSSLREIEGKNDRPFTLAGFGWGLWRCRGGTGRVERSMRHYRACGCIWTPDQFTTNPRLMERCSATVITPPPTSTCNL